MLLFITCLGLSIKSIYTQLKIRTVFEERGLHENALFFFLLFSLLSVLNTSQGLHCCLSLCLPSGDGRSAFLAA